MTFYRYFRRIATFWGRYFHRTFVIYTDWIWKFLLVNMVTLATRPLLSGFLFCILHQVHILKIMISLKRRPRHHLQLLFFIFLLQRTTLFWEPKHDQEIVLLRCIDTFEAHVLVKIYFYSWKLLFLSIIFNFGSPSVESHVATYVKKRTCWLKYRFFIHKSWCFIDNIQL